MRKDRDGRAKAREPYYAEWDPLLVILVLLSCLVLLFLATMN